MAYYVLQNHQGYVSDPGFMQNFTALGTAVGKNIQQQAMKEGVDKNSLIPEYEQDADGNVKTQYKSPALVGRGYYSQGGPGNSKKSKAADPNSLSNSIKDMLAQQASKEAMKQAGSQQLDGSPAGVSGGVKQDADGNLTDPNGGDAGQVSPGSVFMQPSQEEAKNVYLSAIQQQAKDNPAIAKSVGLPTAQKQTFKTGDERMVGDIKYTRQKDGTWLPSS